MTTLPDLTGKRVAIIATDHFEETELTTPRDRLAEAGADEHAQRIVTDHLAAGRPVAAICHAPWLLVSADLVRGRRLTSYPSLADDDRNVGGEWVDETVVVDDNLITSRNPDDLPAFVSAVADALAS